MMAEKCDVEQQRFFTSILPFLKIFRENSHIYWNVKIKSQHNYTLKVRAWNSKFISHTYMNHSVRWEACPPCLQFWHQVNQLLKLFTTLSIFTLAPAKREVKYISEVKYKHFRSQFQLQTFQKSNTLKKDKTTKTRQLILWNQGRKICQGQFDNQLILSCTKTSNEKTGFDPTLRGSYKHNSDILGNLSKAIETCQLFTF